MQIIHTLKLCFIIDADVNEKFTVKLYILIQAFRYSKNIHDWEIV